MEFEIDFYKDSEGNSPVEKFFELLRIKNRLLWQKTARSIEKLKNRAYHREPFSKHIESGLWELRVRSKTDILRVLYTFRKGQIIILLHSFIKKKQKD